MSGFIHRGHVGCLYPLSMLWAGLSNALGGVEALSDSDESGEQIKHFKTKKTLTLDEDNTLKTDVTCHVLYVKTEAFRPSGGGLAGAALTGASCRLVMIGTGISGLST